MPSNSSPEDSSDQSSLLTGDVRAKHMASGQAHSNLWGHTGHPRVRVTRSAGKPLPIQLLLLSAGDGPAETEGRAEAVNPSYSGAPCSPSPWMALASKSAIPDVQYHLTSFPLGCLISSPGLPWFPCSHSRHRRQGPGRLLSHPWLLLWPVRPGCLFLVPGLQSPSCTVG